MEVLIIVINGNSLISTSHWEMRIFVKTINCTISHIFQDHVVLKRSFMVGSGGLVAVLGSQMVGYSGSGPLATIILSFLASSYWKLQGWSNTYVSWFLRNVLLEQQKG